MSKLKVGTYVRTKEWGIQKLHGGESEIFKILLEELKKGTFSDCDEEFQYCCYQIISNLQQENKQLKDNWNKLKEIAKSQSDFKLKIRNKELWFEVDELLSKMQEFEDRNDILKEMK